MSKKKIFDYLCGNPPYNSDFDQPDSQNKNFAAPVYNIFMEAAYSVAEKVELIHPARFLFRAGSTPKDFDDKMLSDTHFKVLQYEQDASNVFPNTDIKGGLVISYRDENKEFGEIGIFIPSVELRSINNKVSKKDFSTIADIVYTQSKFNLENLYKAHPEYQTIIGSDGKDKRFRNNIFEKIDAFTENKTKNNDIPVIGVINNKRVWRFIHRNFVDIQHENLDLWKIILPRANGKGLLGEVLTNPTILKPSEGYTQTFIGLGAFKTKLEAENLLKYIKTKFLRTMLSVLKVDQHNEKDTWKCIPLQDFTPSSDIDWSKSIHEIDEQLYKKYGLDQHEIDFIETNVKEMN